jgi:myxalamid-type polyketide synthase MxaE and MxaD
MPAPSRPPIAIVGIGCRFPQASGPSAYWGLLTGGVDAIGDVPPSRFDASRLYDPTPATPGRINTRWGGFVDLEGFDAEFFGLSPREAERLDPQQRLLLETSWEALEDAGIPVDGLAGSPTGVFVGMWINEYEARLFRDPRQLDFYMTTGSGRYSASGRLSYFFGFQGPSLTVDTGCSASLVAVHLACQSLWTGETSLAVAAGANAILEPNVTIAYSQSRMMAPDGRCKFGDARADGYVRSEGAGVVVLKPLARALADGDRVYATILGTAVNNDGRSSGFLTTPGPAGQEEMLRLAYERAGVLPADVTYVEAHGTGTRAGDPVEIQALGTVLGEGRPLERPCRIGSVKTNIGHTEGAAGMAGLIKVALSLSHRTLVPSLHCETPNPSISWDTLPLVVQQTVEPWPESSSPALAGVSSFGIAGTNAHVVLQQAPRPAHGKAAAGTGPRVLLLSAHTPDALTARAAAFDAAWTDIEATTQVEAVCRAAATRRTHLEHRLAVVGPDAPALAAGIAAAVRGESTAGVVRGRAFPDRRSKVAFLFPGQGSQWVGMGRRLLDEDQAFRRALESCDQAMARETGWSVLEQLRLDADRSRMTEIQVIQPVLLSVEIGLAAAWRARGVEPAAVVGHSMGEVAAAFVAGALSLDDAARIICRRSRLLQRTSGQGAMAVVELTMAEAAAALAGRERDLSVAVSNGTRSTVIAGNPDALDELLGELEGREVFCRRVKVDVASHSPQMDPLRADLLAALADVTPMPASLPIYSTVLDAVTDGAGFDATYWSKNLREPVLFGSAVRRLLADGFDTFIEMSPHPILVPAVDDALRESGVVGAVVVGSTRRDEDEAVAIATALAALHVAGYPVDWHSLLPQADGHVDLPLYPWQRERFWYDSPSQFDLVTDNGVAESKSAHPILGGRRTPAGTGGAWTWQFELGPESGRSATGLHVGGVQVLPLSLIVELVSAGAREWSGGAAVSLTGLELIQPLSAEGRLRLQLSIDGGTFRLHGWRRDQWQLCVQGVVALRTDPLPVDAGTGGERGDAAIDLYRNLSALGMEVAPALRAVGAAGASLSGAWAEVGLPGDADRDALQLVTVIASQGQAPVLRVPVAIGGVDIEAPSGGEVTARCRPDGRGRFDVELRESERLVLRLRGVEVCAVDALLDGVRPERWWHRLEWKPSPPPSTSPGSGTPWLVLGDAEGVGPHVVSGLAERGIPAILASTGDRRGPLAPDRVSLGPDAAEGLARLLAEMAAAGRPFGAVVSLWAPEADDAGPAVAATGRAERAIATIQAFIRRPGDARLPLWLVTRGSQSVPDDGLAVCLSQAPVWGLGRTLAEEHPELWGGLLDLDPHAGLAESAAHVIDSVLATDGEDQVAYRRGDRHVLRLVAAPPPATRARRIRPDATYLIAGGLGALGLVVAEGLIAEGAHRVVLMGRSGVPPRREWRDLVPGSRMAARAAAITRMERLGAAVHVAEVDLSDATRAARWFEEFAEEGWPPIAGVVQCAGLFEPQLLGGIDAATTSAVMRSKVGTTWHLHELTAGMALDFFVIFSSVGSFLTEPGKGTYAAANAFVDVLAHHRRSLGLPATTINWGPWTVGMAVAPTERGAGMDLRGVESLRPARGMAALMTALRSDVTQVAVMPFAARRWSRGADVVPFLRELTSAATPEPADRGAATTMRARLGQIESGEDRDLELQDYLQDQVAQILKRPSSRIDRLKPLKAMGFDSLMAIELRNRLEAVLDLRLPATLAFNYPTIVRLSSHLLDRLSIGVPAPDASSTIQAADDLERLLAEVEQLPDEEAARLLSGPLADV